ncbi:MAG: Lnb N-terminal periplasmic domain-containing protein [Gammaproteobacteria bacterium]
MWLVWAQVVILLLGALHAVAAFFYFSKARHAAVWAGGWIVLAALCAWSLPRFPLTAGTGYFAALLTWTIWWESIHPLTKRDWVTENARQATGEIAEERLTIRNLRNFDWTGSHEFTVRWEDRTYDLRNLTALDLFVCTWGDPNVAHLIVSFIFKDTLPLAFSIETRRETTEHWSMLAGFMRAYELIIIAADERDVIRVRTNIRRERVQRYRLRSNPAMRRKLLVQYIKSMNDLNCRPLFYNTVFRNCSTEVVRILRAAGLPAPIDWRILMSGHVPEYLRRLGLIDSRQPFDDMRENADIVALPRDANADPNYSTHIRSGAGDIESFSQPDSNRGVNQQ